MSQPLLGKVALVTGAARGIGRACARRFSEEGASIVIGDLQPEAGAVAVAEIEAAGGVASFVPLDVTSPAQNAELASAAVERHERCHDMGAFALRIVEQTAIDRGIPGLPLLAGQLCPLLAEPFTEVSLAELPAGLDDHRGLARTI